MTTAVNIDLAHLARELGLPVEKVQRTLELLDDGNTVAFITRFRKDQTGGLNEEQVQSIQREATKEKLLADRKVTILRSIESQGRLTPELAAQINSARTLKWLEDVYLPFKPKKQTLATTARERGLEPLATQILNADPAVADLQARAAEFVSPEKGVGSTDEVLQGVRHILAEQFSERPDVRGRLRRIMRRTGVLTSSHIEPTGPVEKSESAPPAAATHESPSAGDASAIEEGPAKQDVAADLATADSSHDAAQSMVSGEVAEVQTPGSEPGFTEPNTGLNEGGVSESETTVHQPQAGSELETSATATQTMVLDEPAAVTESEVSPSEAVAPAGGSASESKPNPLDRKASRKLAAKERKRKLFENAFKDYYNFREPIARLPPHRVLAINRGERAKVLRVRLECNQEELATEAIRLLVPEGHPHSGFLVECVRDALQRLLVPSLEREMRRELTEEAEEHAVKVFAGNLRKLLLQPPVRGKRVLAVDPAFRSGCKLAALDQFGNLIEHGTMHVIGNEDQRNHARAFLADFIRRHQIAVVAIGNGTACRETEQLVSDVIGNELKDTGIAYVIVNEAGTSVYSTSQIGREELPNCDAMIRSAVSIGRRLLDPLSELVKINPANIGVGMYQHDVKAKHLRDSLDGVVNSCVNFVGVDVNTASPSLLSYVSGLNQLTARRLYEYRMEHGPFRSREQIKSVPGIGEATFVQAAGFLKITSGDNPLDSTWIHPESYSAALQLLEKLNIPLTELSSHGPGESAPTSEAGAHSVDASSPTAVESPSAEGSVEENLPVADDAQASVVSTTSSNDAPAAAEPQTSEPPPQETLPAEAAAVPVSDEVTRQGDEPRVAVTPRPSLAERLSNVNIEELSRELGIGELTLRDIVADLSRPGRDPRDDFSPPPFRTGIMKLDDLRPGMELQGTVLNVVDFGAFVDIGISDSALIHISKLADRFIRDPQEVVSVGDVLKVWVLDVDKGRRRVSLTAIDPQAPPRERPHRERRPRRGKRPPQQQPASRGTPPATERPPQRQRQAPPKIFTKPKAKAPPKKPPKPVRPITPGMLSGKQPMRSFSDLLQFYEKKKTDSDEPGT